MTATATQALSSFVLDLAGMEVGAVWSTARRPPSPEGDRDLRITPGVAAGRGGRSPSPAPVRPPLSPATSSSTRGSWDDGEVYALFEPDGAATLFPSNDHPSDKASYEFRVTAPDDLEVVANGRLTGTVPVTA